MNIFDVIGPVMVGPSSSHTAGAVRIGNVCRKLMDEDIKEAKIFFHGSFLTTGKGHGTDKAIVAGLMGFAVNDERIPDSYRIADERGLNYSFGSIDLGDDAHPNSVKMLLTGISGKKLDVIAASVGGGRIRICTLDGITVNFTGDYPTLIVHNLDKPGHVAKVTGLLQQQDVNIATMQLYRTGRGQDAVMVVECDEEVPSDVIRQLENREGIVKVTYLGLKD